MSHEIKWVWMDPSLPAFYEAKPFHSAYHWEQLFDKPSMAVKGARAWSTYYKLGQDSPDYAAVPVRLLREAESHDTYVQFGKRVQHREGTWMVEVWPEGT